VTAFLKKESVTITMAELSLPKAATIMVPNKRRSLSRYVVAEFGCFWVLVLKKRIRLLTSAATGKVIRDWVRFGADWFVKPRMVRPVGEANLPSGVLFEFRVHICFALHLYRSTNAVT
jgi:hypothetical protein